MDMRRAYKIIVYILCLTGLASYKKCYAMPMPMQYHYNDVDFTNHVKHDLLSNRAIILVGSSHKKITVGNEKVAKKYRSLGINHVSLHTHHVLFKGIRITFPGVPYLCMQTPKDHHKQYHNDSPSTNINFQSFNNMLDYLNQLKLSIFDVSQLMQQDPNHGQYSNICNKAAQIAVSCQKYWISHRYSWLYSIQNGKHLMLAQRLVARDCFPNNALANKHLCQQKVSYIREQLSLSKFVVSEISDDSPAVHLKQLLRARIRALNVYTTQFITLTSNAAYDIANHRYGDSERFHDPMRSTSDGNLSDASSLDE